MKRILDDDLLRFPFRGPTWAEKVFDFVGVLLICLLVVGIVYIGLALGMTSDSQSESSRVSVVAPHD